eukprot:GDKI01042079.1.p1 GENE.GDKI01042079.1~~GDKI01042079.1.p1  ORF type:complete len:250 (-),score=51.00 GDKI01042079.1:70-819(-)
MGLHSKNGRLMAVKEIQLETQSEYALRQLESFRGEISVLKRMQHANIVRYLGLAQTDEHLRIVMEFVPGGSIASLLKKFGALRESVAGHYTRQICAGLEYLHRHKVVHRDIKGANVLLRDDGVVKLADFGCAKALATADDVTAKCETVKGTPLWMAPEVLLGKPYSTQADVWSLGCTVVEMLTGKPPFSEFSSPIGALMMLIQKERGPQAPDSCSDTAADFIHACLEFHPEDRPTAAELLRHPFVTGVV